MVAYAAILAVPLVVWFSVCAHIFRRRWRTGLAYAITPVLLVLAGVVEVLIRGGHASPLGALLAATTWLVALTIAAKDRSEALSLLVLAAFVFVGSMASLMIFGANLHAILVALAQQIVIPPR